MAVRTQTDDIDDLYITTAIKMRKSIEDQIFGSTKLLKYMMAKGRVKDISGGRWMEIPLRYATMTSVVSAFGKTHDFTAGNTAAKSLQTLTDAKVEWRNMYIPIYRNWEEDQENKGTEKIFSLMEEKLENAKLSMMEVLSDWIFGSNDHSTDITFEGIGNWIKDVPNATYANRYTQGNISQGDYDNDGVSHNTWWNNQATAMTGYNVSVFLREKMTTAFNNCSKGMLTEYPDIIVMPQALHENFETITTEQKLIVNDTKGDPAFESIAFKGKPVIWDDDCPAAHIYMLNFQYFYLGLDPDVKFSPTNWKEETGSVDRFMQILLRGNLICTNRSKQAVLYDVGV